MINIFLRKKFENSKDEHENKDNPNKEEKMVVNVLRDGTIVKDMSTITVPINETTKRAYELIAKANKNMKGMN